MIVIAFIPYNFFYFFFFLELGLIYLQNIALCIISFLFYNPYKLSAHCSSPAATDRWLLETHLWRPYSTCFLGVLHSNINKADI